MISCRCTVDRKILFKPNKLADEWLSSHYEVYSLGQLGNKLSLAAYFCFSCYSVHIVLRLTRYCTIQCPRPIAMPSRGLSTTRRIAARPQRANAPLQIWNSPARFTEDAPITAGFQPASVPVGASLSHFSGCYWLLH
jgi:hypothetical protein